jgi:small subunit ribosomal protein S17
MPKRVAIGVVTSDKTAKTRRVEIPRQVRHPKYGKILHRKTVCHVHDENNDSHQGDTVEIVECPPKSRTKRWQLVRVVQKSRAVDLAAMRAAAKALEGDLAQENQ